MMPNPYKLYYERNLPHYQPPEATLFITFRLAGSIPKESLNNIHQMVNQKIMEIERSQDLSDRETRIFNAQAAIFEKFDHALDNALKGPLWLKRVEIADLVCESIHYWDKKRYCLEAYCVMPNHVHLVCTPLFEGDGFYPIAKIMQSLKGFTARKAYQILGREGSFWQSESYDHVIRDFEEENRIIEYVLNNPIMAGLAPRWVYCRP